MQSDIIAESTLLNGERMTADKALDQVLKDIEKIACALDELDVDGVLTFEMFEYFGANAETLKRLIEDTYANCDETERAGLLTTHQELDCSVVDVESQEDALTSLSDIEQFYLTAQHSRIAASCVQIELDDYVKPILRSLRLGRYCRLKGELPTLNYSPVELFIKRPFKNWLEATENEVLSVPWHLANVLYADKKKVVVSECQGLGLNLIEIQKSNLPDRFPESIQIWTAKLKSLVSYRIECDLTAIYMVNPGLREKLRNRLLDRVDREYNDIRLPLIKVLMYFLEDISNEHQRYLVAEEHLVGFGKEFDELKRALPTIQPSAKTLKKMKKCKLEEIRMAKFEIAGDFHNNGFIGDDNKGEVTVQTGSIDHSLKKELQALADALEARSPKKESDQRDIRSLTEAASEAEKGNSNGVAARLKGMGVWVLDTAKDIGVGLAVEAIKKANGG